MNKQAFADIETINVRVEERRSGAKGQGNWRVHEFSGIDAIPARLRGAFDRGKLVDSHVVPLDARVREAYASRRPTCQFEDSYEVPCGDDLGTVATVMRTITVSMTFRRKRLALPQAA